MEATKLTQKKERRSEKVLLIVTRLNIGGVAKHVVRLAKGLRELGYEVLVAAGQVDAHEGDMAFYAREHDISIATIPELGRAIRWNDDFKAFLKLYQLVKKFRPDVVHTHTAKAGTLGRIGARLHKTRLIVHTYHGHVFQGYFSPLKTKMILWIEKILAKLTGRIITLSELQKRELQKIYKLAPETKLSVVPLDFDRDEFLASAKYHIGLHKEIALPNEAKIVAAVGRIVPIKAPELFLKIARNIIARHANVHFVFVGRGEEEAEARALVSNLGLVENVHFLGWRKDIAAMYNEIDLLLITSKNEGTPYTILEAMAAGCPVVATDVGGIPDMIAHGKTGLLFASGDVDAGTDAVEKVLYSPQLKNQIATQAIEFIDAHFSCKQSVTRMDQLYQTGLKTNL
ncbi:MAG: glycosyltransferase family 4 protein [bacterium]